MTAEGILDCVRLSCEAPFAALRERGCAYIDGTYGCASLASPRAAWLRKVQASHDEPAAKDTSRNISVLDAYAISNLKSTASPEPAGSKLVILTRGSSDLNQRRNIYHSVSTRTHAKFIAR